MNFACKRLHHLQLLCKDLIDFFLVFVSFLLEKNPHKHRLHRFIISKFIMIFQWVASLSFSLSPASFGYAEAVNFFRQNEHGHTHHIFKDARVISPLKYSIRHIKRCYNISKPGLGFHGKSTASLLDYYYYYYIKFRNGSDFFASLFGAFTFAISSMHVK